MNSMSGYTDRLGLGRPHAIMKTHGGRAGTDKTTHLSLLP